MLGLHQENYTIGPILWGPPQAKLTNPHFPFGQPTGVGYDLTQVEQKGQKVSEVDLIH
jgi:hypothetical protein